MFFSVQKLPDPFVLPKRKAFSDLGLSPAAEGVFAESPKRRAFAGTRPLTAEGDGSGTPGGEGENYMSRRAPRAGTMPPCRHPGHGAARPGRAAGCRMPVWIPPRAEGPPGPGKLQFPACPAAGAPAYGTDRARERVGLKHGFSSMETGPPAAGRSHRRADGQWGEAGGPGG